MWAPGLALRQKINKTARADSADASAAAAAPRSFESRGYSLSKTQSKVPETPGMGKPKGENLIEVSTKVIQGYG